ncbi:hypothetical protein FB451DRAFT_1408022 [Mycena latifolia]|nr:hypothetical protein FB451DRAFT_1408022 [Mycena latifolia]
MIFEQPPWHKRVPRAPAARSAAPELRVYFSAPCERLNCRVWNASHASCFTLHASNDRIGPSAPEILIMYFWASRERGYRDRGELNHCILDATYALPPLHTHPTSAAPKISTIHFNVRSHRMFKLNLHVSNTRHGPCFRAHDLHASRVRGHALQRRRSCSLPHATPWPTTRAQILFDFSASRERVCADSVAATLPTRPDFFFDIWRAREPTPRHTHPPPLPPMNLARCVAWKLRRQGSDASKVHIPALDASYML